MKITIVHLYPKEMNIYGDNGNVLALKKRLEWRGIKTEVVPVGIGQDLPAQADIIFGGGGQDAGQANIQVDLQTKAGRLRQMAKDGVVMLMICGMYQLFGREFLTVDGLRIEGIGVLPITTIGGKQRFIGNTLYSFDGQEIVGYENHSGLTTLEESAQPLARVLRGAGNNGLDKTEGCRLENVFGTYSHGPILPKNPRLTDKLLNLALQRQQANHHLSSLDDSLENAAFASAKSRSR